MVKEVGADLVQQHIALFPLQLLLQLLDGPLGFFQLQLPQPARVVDARRSQQRHQQAHRHPQPQLIWRYQGRSAPGRRSRQS